MTTNSIIANITWNPYGWRNLYTNPKAGHKYVQTHPGHESLNFNFDKKGIDTPDKIYGYVQWTYPPKEFTEGGIILFYSKNLQNNEHQIVRRIWQCVCHENAAEKEMDRV